MVDLLTFFANHPDGAGPKEEPVTPDSSQPKTDEVLVMIQSLTSTNKILETKTRSLECDNNRLRSELGQLRTQQNEMQQAFERMQRTIDSEYGRIAPKSRQPTLRFFAHEKKRILRRVAEEAAKDSMTAGPACTKPVSKTQRLAKELNILRASEQPTNDGLPTETEQKEPIVDKSAVPTDATEAAVVPVTAPQESPIVDKSAVPTDATEAAVVPVTAPQESPIAAVTVTTVESPSAAAPGSPEASSVASTTPPPVNASGDSPVQSSAAADAHSPPSPAVASLIDAHVVQPIQQPSVSLPSSPIDSVFASSAKSNVAADARSPVDSAVASPKVPHISSVATSTADSPAALPSRLTAVTYTPLSDFHSAPASLPNVASVHEPVPPAAAAFILSAHLNNEPEQEPPKEHGKQDRKKLKRQHEHTSDDGASFSDPQILPGVESPSQPVYQYPLQHRLFQSSAPADPEVMPPSPFGKLPSMLTTFSSSTAVSLGAVNPTLNAPIIVEQSKSPDATADVPMGNDQEVVGSSQRTGEAENDMELDKLELLQVINLVQSPNAWSHTQQVADEDVKMDGVDIQAVHTHDQIMTGTGTQSTEQDIQPAVQRRYSETLFYEEPVQIEPMVIDRRIAPLPLRAQRRQAAKSAVDDESRRKSARVARETRHQLHADEDKSSTDDSEEGRVSRRPRFMAGDNGQTTDIPSLKDIREQDRRTVAHQVQWNHTHESVAMLFDIFDREGYSPNWDDERERRHLGEHCWKQLLQRNRPAPGAVIDRNTFARWYAEWMREIVTFVSLPGSQRIIGRGDVTKIFNMWMAAQSEHDKVTLEKTFAE
ncbi:hypothetical protein Cob_v006485 [Colletotrichum orbiculare MAFF 240422]|uniref:Uncharacterized protein n=1 Tax=Colletotrichum orbiculare (strain 104-T / ATCC 96160 / CBS 514.97 / LARS 414 / MAFF 240422) TaxID=1213857 RepID=A0A484FRY6_COLOR|nr:hypothetical protein Cob_v006485 [Colletotrichum orbiculare MAFF 240422]